MASETHENNSIRVGIFLLLVFTHFLCDNCVDGRKIQGENGEVIDCVDIHKQPAFSHPLLKNHILQMRPSSSPDALAKHEKIELFQSWQKFGKCPKGTIPILRTKLFKNRKRQIIIGDTAPQPTALGIKRHEIAGATLLPAVRPYYGTYARIGIWNPETFDGEFSLSEVRLDAGIIGKVNEYNSIEVGWKKLEGHPKVFIHWTRDHSNVTGCYHLNCPGFVQVDPNILLGGDLSRFSTYNGAQIDLPISVFKDMKSGNWWLKLNSQEVGYWPGTIFTSLAKSASQISWLGEITDSKRDYNHTSTQMGNGHLPSEGYRKAAMMNNIQYIDELGHFVDADHDNNLMTFAVTPGCYDVKIEDKKRFPALRVHFHYGGPLFSPTCHTRHG